MDSTPIAQLFMADKVIKMEIGLGKELNVNNALSPSQQKVILQLLQENQSTFAWDYMDMKGLDPMLCTHKIYISTNLKHVRQPQRRVNLILKDIVKNELHKLLSTGLIYPISDSQRVSPLVIVPKKGGKWRFCVDYKELNSATKKDHFPLPFIDQVLDSLAGKSIFLFWMVSVVAIRFK